MSHTPGPWEFVPKRDIVAPHEGVPAVAIAEVWMGRPEYEANARLITEAPELLEALESAERDLMALHWLMEVSVAVEVEGIRQAIAKARGS